MFNKALQRVLRGPPRLSRVHLFLEGSAVPTTGGVVRRHLSGSDSSGDEAPACPSSSENDPVEFRHVAIAQANIKDRIIMTPCQKSLFLSEYLGIECYLKKELFQQTGSFKERGALNRLLNLSAKQKEVGVVAASAGNHALVSRVVRRC